MSKAPDIQAITKAVTDAVIAALAPPDQTKLLLKIIKRDTDKRLLTVITNTVTDPDGTPVVDHDGDVIKIGNLEDVFIQSFAKGGAGMGDEMHDETDKIDVVQHFTLSRGEWSGLGKAMGVELPPMPEVGIAKLFVKDDDLWAATKAGQYTEVSISGDGERREM